ncbi:Nucleoredoxin [Thalictrum thalictroides]|uniref:protein-disulfide reductase n=1 Tax=Thalictrum thalictroides TaxID=46969 RepID=A0A7J6X5G1_THATH|nr:Nucleoredoxin [Thalictrum thalictroides]
MDVLSAVVKSEEEDMSLLQLLKSETRDFLITPSGDQVKVEDLEGKTVGIYFSANWYSKCQHFTPILVDVYHQLMEQGAKFDIVFVSSDEDQNSFDVFYGTMPWLAIPFSDLQSKKNLTQKFQIEGIPSLVILDSSSKPIQTDGVELIYRYGVQAFPFTSTTMAELEAEESAKHASQTIGRLLSTDSRDYVLRQNEQVPISQLVGRTVGLYFSAQWCPPCVKFTPRLVTVYQQLKEKNEDFEIVFISIDRDETGYMECYQSMPWLALPYGDETAKALLRYFHVQGIPTLIIIGPDGKTVTREGRNLINLHLEMAYPFTEAQLSLLQDRLDEEAKNYPNSIHHIGHRHILNLVSASSGGGPFICCECDEQGSGWAYQCIECGYEIHLKCVRESEKDALNEKQLRTVIPSCACSSGY